MCFNSGYENPIRPLIFPPPYSEINCDVMRVDPYAKDPSNLFWDKSKEFSIGMIFRSREAVIAATKEYHMLRHYQFCYDETKSRTYSIKCKDKLSGYQWHLRASRKENANVWKIIRYNGPHTCRNAGVSKDHGHLDSRFICAFILPMIKQQPDMKVATLQAEIKDKVGYEPSYKKTWMGKQFAIEKIFGGWEESYGRLRKFMHAIVNYNPDTVIAIEDDLHWIEGRLDGNVRVFDRMFWAFQQSIEGFKFCRPVIFVDGTFLYGKYSGCILCATGLDGNNMIFPLAFALVEKEDSDNWGWFMDCLRLYVTDREELCVISDRHIGIKKAMQKDWWQPPSANHRYCIRHILSNYNTKFKNTDMKEALRTAANQNQKRKFYDAMNKIRKVSPETFEWALKIPLETWTWSHDGGKRYGSMTTNTIESVNGMLKGFRALPVTAMVEKIFYQCAKYFDIRRTAYLNQMQMGHTFTHACAEVIRNNKMKVARHRVTRFSNETLVFEVRTSGTGNKQVVKLIEGTCTCGKFQEMRIPCSHAIAACLSKSMDYYQYVDTYYTLERTLKCYGSMFNPLGHSDYWPEPDGKPLIPDMQRIRKKGRPRSSRIQNEMDWRASKVSSTSKNHYTVCGKSGHNK
ncbi:uncharacterized protein LOC110624190 [Manihot esculenta]|uniref:uncharacterized protein LOC110624190 n=1 Tax=Manihot esculenta TaxID=3983 RepID=UPI000B5D8FC0|nr:uncharacterized protein LOC110624190 [Manihot esculenta]